MMDSFEGNYYLQMYLWRERCECEPKRLLQGELPTRFWVGLCVVPGIIRVVIELCCDGDDIDHNGYDGEIDDWAPCRVR